jgi:DNA-binding protein
VKRKNVVPVLVIATLFLTSSTAGAISIKAAGKQYMKDVASANAALKTFDSEIKAWTNATADAEGEQQAASVLTALGTLRKNLLSQTWPQFVKGGVRFICEEDISSLVEDLHMIGGNSSLGNGAFQLTFRADSKITASDAFYVRRDLGLSSSRAL